MPSNDVLITYDIPTRHERFLYYNNLARYEMKGYDMYKIAGRIGFKTTMAYLHHTDKNRVEWCKLHDPVNHYRERPNTYEYFEKWPMAFDERCRIAWKEVDKHSKEDNKNIRELGFERTPINKTLPQFVLDRIDKNLHHLYTKNIP